MLKSGMSPCQGDGPARRQARDDVPLGGTRTARGRGMPAHGAGTGVSRPGRGTGDGPASPGGDAPPILFRLAEKECAVHGGRKRRLGAKPAPLAPFLLKCGGRANPCVRNLLGFRRVRRTAQEQRTCSPAFGTAQRLSGVVIVRALPLAPRVPLRYALPRPFSGRVSKGEGPQPRPFVSLGGVGETGEAPPAADEASLFRGSGAIGGPEKGPGIAMPRRC